MCSVVMCPRSIVNSQVLGLRCRCFSVSYSATLSILFLLSKKTSITVAYRRCSWQRLNRVDLRDTHCYIPHNHREMSQATKCRTINLSTHPNAVVRMTVATCNRGFFPLSLSLSFTDVSPS